ncbi:MAG: hypothetical protein JNL38_05200 [Myxococcales bacterium]|nr:hypothetical protein [Myxococcales bacterium]
MQRFHRHAITLVVVLGGLRAVAGCGSRGPLDTDPLVQPATGDASDAATSDAAEDSSARDASTDRAAPRDARAEAGPLDCPVCLLQDCGTKILECVQDAGCRDTLQCVLGTCLQGGGLDAACAFGCAKGDPGGALKVLQVFQCVTQTCGPDCSDLLGLITGGAGGGGGGGGGPPPPPPPPVVDAGKKPAPPPAAPEIARARAVIDAAFSPWPELATRDRP